jgi:hypothetical protein
MGEIVKSRLFEPKNVVITCSSSGQLTSSLVAYWCDHHFVPFIGSRTLLLSDSWPGQNDKKLYDDIKSARKYVKYIQIPQHTTSDIQPLDKYYNRQIKNLRNVSTTVLLWTSWTSVSMNLTTSASSSQSFPINLAHQPSKR